MKVTRPVFHARLRGADEPELHRAPRKFGQPSDWLCVSPLRAKAQSLVKRKRVAASLTQGLAHVWNLSVLASLLRLGRLNCDHATIRGYHGISDKKRIASDLFDLIISQIGRIAIIEDPLHQQGIDFFGQQ